MTPFLLLLVAISGLLGLAFGSFASVLVVRVPKAGKGLTAASACPNCGQKLSWYQNIPVLSWLLLRGKCANCQARISALYPLLEIGIGAGFAFIAANLLGQVPWDDSNSVVRGLLEFVAFGALLTLGVALAIIDAKTGLLPNRIVLWLYLISLPAIAIAAASSSAWDALLRAVLAGLASVLLFWLIRLISPSGMGLGDLKVSGVLGFCLGWMGWGALVVGALAAFALGAAFGVVLLMAGKAKRGTAIPFGPWLILGAAIGALFGNSLWGQYLLFIARLQI